MKVVTKISYKGLNYTATVKVVEAGLEKTLDASALTSIVPRGYSLSQYIANNPKVKYDGNDITLTAGISSIFSINRIKRRVRIICSASRTRS